MPQRKMTWPPVKLDKQRGQPWRGGLQAEAQVSTAQQPLPRLTPSELSGGPGGAVQSHQPQLRWPDQQLKNRDSR